MPRDEATGTPDMPLVPCPGIRAEVERVLMHDDSALGDVWRRTVQGETAEQIQSARGTERPNSVWNYRRMATALLEGDLPTASTVAGAVARAFARVLRATDLTPEARALLQHNLQILRRRATSGGQVDDGSFITKQILAGSYRQPRRSEYAVATAVRWLSTVLNVTSGGTGRLSARRPPRR